MNTTPSKSTTVEAAADAGAQAESLVAEIAALRAEFQVLVEKIGAVGAAAKVEATSVARTGAARGIEAGERVAGDIADEWRALDARVVDAARMSPWRTLGVAALIGLIIGLFLRR